VGSFPRHTAASEPQGEALVISADLDIDRRTVVPAVVTSLKVDRTWGGARR